MMITQLFVILTCFVYLCPLSSARNAVLIHPADTLIYLGGRAEAVNITELTTTSVHYTNLKTKTIFEADRKLIEKIIYRTGTVEVLNRPVFETSSDDHWRHVLLTEDPEDIQGLYEIGPVYVSAAASRNRRLTVRNAEIRLKRQAGSLGADVVLVTSTEFKGGFRDVPTIIMEGIAYGIAPIQ
jgi:hypothetical protein